MARVRIKEQEGSYSLTEAFASCVQQMASSRINRLNFRLRVRRHSCESLDS